MPPESRSHPQSLPEGCQALAIANYKPLLFAPFKTPDDILTDKVQFEVQQTRQNEWMEQRYKDQVPVELLNPLPSNTPLLPAALLPKEPEQRLCNQDEVAHYERQIRMLRLREEYWGNEKELQHVFLQLAARCVVRHNRGADDPFIGLFNLRNGQQNLHRCSVFSEPCSLAGFHMPTFSDSSQDF